MTHLYLHIGVPKTATKTIQLGLRLNQAALLAQGYYLPSQGSMANGGLAHHNIARGIASHDRYNPHNGDLPRLIEEIEGQPHERVIVSSETFSNLLRPQHIQRLRDQLPQHWQVSIVVYLRRQDELLHSWWAQLAKTMQRTDPFDVVGPKLVNNLWAANYERLLTLWEASFGWENMRVSLFEAALQQGHIFNHFLHTCDVSQATDFAVPASTNTTPSEKTLVIAQAITHALPPLRYVNPAETVARRVYYNEVLLPFAQQAGWNDSKINKLTPPLRESLMAAFDDGNRAVARRYFQRDVLFGAAPPPPPVTHHNPDDYTTDELRALIYLSAAAHLDQQTELIAMRERAGEVNAALVEGQRAASDFERLKHENAQLAESIRQLEQELALRRSLPLARVSELLHGAQRELQAGGVRGVMHRSWAWARGERSRGATAAPEADVRHLYLHIGVHKTGSTTIQHGLYANREWLAQQGYFLPKTGGNPHAQADAVTHHKIAHELTQHPHQQAHSLVQKLIAEVRSQTLTHVIVSSEAFDDLATPDQIATLTQQLPDAWRLHVVVYVRRQDALLHSYWSQMVKTGLLHGEFDMVLPQLIDGRRAAHYDAFLQNWEAHVGKDRLHVRVFEEAVRDGHLLTSFFQACGLTDLTAVTLPPITNDAPSEKAMALLLDVGAHIDWSADDPRALAQRRFFKGVIYPFTQRMNWTDDKVNRLTPALHHEIMTHYAADNRDVARRYFDRDDLFDTRFTPAPVNPFNPSAFTVEELKALVYKIASAYVDKRHALIEQRRQLGREQRQLRQLQGQGHLNKVTELATLEQDNAQLGPRLQQLHHELAMRQSLPLARLSELLFAARRELQAGGVSGFVRRLGAWLRGERRFTRTE